MTIYRKTIAVRRQELASCVGKTEKVPYELKKRVAGDDVGERGKARSWKPLFGLHSKYNKKVFYLLNRE